MIAGIVEWIAQHALVRGIKGLMTGSPLVAVGIFAVVLLGAAGTAGIYGYEKGVQHADNAVVAQRMADVQGELKAAQMARDAALADAQRLDKILSAREQRLQALSQQTASLKAQLTQEGDHDPQVHHWLTERVPGPVLKLLRRASRKNPCRDPARVSAKCSSS